MTELTQAERDTFTPTMDAAMNSFASIPEDVRGKMMADYGKILAGDEEMKAAAEARKVEYFGTADADADGVLNLGEYKAYVALHKAHAEEKYGGSMVRTD